jgi:hypothetical protein
VSDPAAVGGPLSAKLHGHVNPEGSDTHYFFQYGLTSAYGSQAPATAQDAGAGSSQVQVQADVSGLSPATVYHYRLVAMSSAGTSYGKDVSFRTDAACRDRMGPISRFDPRRTKVTHAGILAVGHSRDRGGCVKDVVDPRDRGGISRVTISIERQTSLQGLGLCRPLEPSLRFGAQRDCRKFTFFFTVHGSRWHLHLHVHLPSGLYRLFAMAYDLRGNRDPIDPKKRNGIFIKLR